MSATTWGLVLTFARAYIRALMFGGGARLSPGYTTANPTDFFDVVDSVGFFLEEVLIEMSAERGGCESLMAVLAFFVLGGGPFGCT